MNEELAKELAAIQDELSKLKPAVEYVEAASESVSKVDEKVPKLLQKMGALKISAKKLKGEVDETFSSLQAIGEEVSGKIDGINNQVNEALNTFAEDGQNLKNELGQQFQSKITETEKLVSDVDVTLKSINEEYQSQVKSLIAEIKAKSKEIHSIYKELEKIKSARREYVDFMSEAEEKFKVALENLETNKWGNIIVDDTGKTSIDKVYAGGDIVLGAATVILAMGEGRRAANSINKLLIES